MRSNTFMPKQMQQLAEPQTEFRPENIMHNLYCLGMYEKCRNAETLTDLTATVHPEYLEMYNQKSNIHNTIPAKCHA